MSFREPTNIVDWDAAVTFEHYESHPNQRGENGEIEYSEDLKDAEKYKAPLPPEEVFANAVVRSNPNPNLNPTPNPNPNWRKCSRMRFCVLPNLQAA